MLYFYIIGIIIILFCFKLFVIEKVRIKWKTFLQKGFKAKRGNFGLYTYTGNQGKGKTLSLVEYIYDNKEQCIFFSNIKNIKCLNYINLNNNNESLNVDILDKYNINDSKGIGIYYKGLDGLVEKKIEFDNGMYDNLIKDKQVVFVFDELFTELTRHTTLSQQVQDFLCQLRKRKIIFLTTAQVWSELPLYLRRMCRYQINCNIINLPTYSILIKEFRDAENMKWDNDTQEHVAPTLETTITKCRKIISSQYDTMERITNDNVRKNENKQTIS